MSVPKIDSFEFGRVVIDGEVHTKDVIILPDGVIGGWWRIEGHALHPEDLKAVIAADPDVLVVGKGTSERMRITEQTRQALGAARIELVSGNSEVACQQYNQLREQRKVAAALHLTC